MNDDKSNENKKIFYFYYDMCCQSLVVYPGITSNEIKSTIREILNIPTEAQVEYLEENGFPIVVSSFLPDKIKIYVKIKKTFTEKFIEEQAKTEKKNNPSAIEWFWLESSEPKYHLRKNNNKTIYQPYNECIATTRGDLIIESGEIYYTLLFEPLQFCVHAGIFTINSSKNKEEEKEEDIFLHSLDFWGKWPDYEDPHNNFPGPTIEAGFYINMDLKLLIVYDNKKKKEIFRKNFPVKWTKICPVVVFKHVVSITISSDAIKGKPSFINI